MSVMKMISAAHIQRLEKERDEKLTNMLDSYEHEKQESWKQKEQWLEVFERCLSPTIASKQIGVSLHTYRRWRNTDPEFCRAINRSLELAHEELQGSAYSRATGYLKPSDETESGYEEDAAGTPIRYGSSDRLAIAILQPPRHIEEAAQPAVNISLNFAAVGVTEPPVIEGATVSTQEAPQLTHDEQEESDREK